LESFLFSAVRALPEQAEIRFTWEFTAKSSPVYKYAYHDEASRTLPATEAKSFNYGEARHFVAQGQTAPLPSVFVPVGLILSYRDAFI
jgi:hypothetical protein